MFLKKIFTEKEENPSGLNTEGESMLSSEVHAANNPHKVKIL